jgi:hypothetical protein
MEQALAKARKLAQAQLATLAIESGSKGRSHICARIRGNLELNSVDDVIRIHRNALANAAHISGMEKSRDARTWLRRESF